MSRNQPRLCRIGLARLRNRVSPLVLTFGQLTFEQTRLNKFVSNKPFNGEKEIGYDIPWEAVFRRARSRFDLSRTSGVFFLCREEWEGHELREVYRALVDDSACGQLGDGGGDGICRGGRVQRVGDLSGVRDGIELHYV